MKLFSHIRTRPRRSKVSAFTLVEMMISVGIFVGLFVGVMVAIQIFGLRVYTLAATKLTATADGRKAMNQMRDDIRQAKTLQVGTFNPSSAIFSANTGTNLAQGTALQIYSISNGVAPYTIYYLDTTTTYGTAANYLVAYMVAANGAVTTSVLSKYITNSIVFDAEDYRGDYVTNSLQNNQVYRITLQFYQWEYPIGFTGSGHALNEYNYYQLRTRVARRALD